MGWVRPVVIIGALLCLSSLAGAENKEKARGLYRTGIQHYNLGEYVEALENFKSAYREFEDASFLYNIAQCQRVLDQKKEAMRSYRAFLRESHEITPALRSQIDAIVAGLEASLRDEQAAANARAAQPVPQP